MPVFLLWNLARRPLAGEVAQLVGEHRVDVLVLLESAVPRLDLRLALMEVDEAFEDVNAASVCRRVEIYTRLSAARFVPMREDAHFTIRRCEFVSGTEMLVAAAHLRSGRHTQRETQDDECQLFAREIRRAEEEAGHTRTLVIGDLNQNPFGPGVASANALNAVLSRRTAQRGARMVNRVSRPLFYNPMWGHFSESTPGPPGTFYRSGHDVLEYHWNIFDQVLLRPSLLPLFSDGDLRILGQIGERSLLTPRGLPKLAGGSDHLPLLFTLASPTIA